MVLLSSKGGVLCFKLLEVATIPTVFSMVKFSFASPKNENTCVAERTQVFTR